VEVPHHRARLAGQSEGLHHQQVQRTARCLHSAEIEAAPALLSELMILLWARSVRGGRKEDRRIE
jgi:hypothetical protein